MKTSTRRILWAIDAFDSLRAMQSDMARVLEELTRGRDGVRIDPFCLLDGGETKWIFQTEDEEVPLLLPEDIRASVASWLAKLGLPGVAAPEFLDFDDVRAEAIAKVILDRAHETGAGLIAVSSHGRHGLDRLLLGSVAETLISLSDVPVLVMNPRVDPILAMERILVPTDFSAPSRAAFEAALDLAAERGARVVLLFESSLRVTPTPRPQSSADDEARWAREAAETWKAAATERGIECELRLGDRAGDVAQAVSDSARAIGAGLIVMATHAGALRMALGGSVAREVARNAGCPVIAWRPIALEPKA